MVRFIYSYPDRNHLSVEPTDGAGTSSGSIGVNIANFEAPAIDQFAKMLLRPS
jgi:hypothetical protein